MPLTPGPRQVPGEPSAYDTPGDDRARAERTELVNRARRPRRGGYQRTRAESAFGAELPPGWHTARCHWPTTENHCSQGSGSARGAALTACPDGAPASRRGNLAPGFVRIANAVGLARGIRADRRDRAAGVMSIRDRGLTMCGAVRDRRDPVQPGPPGHPGCVAEKATARQRHLAVHPLRREKRAFCTPVPVSGSA